MRDLERLLTGAYPEGLRDVPPAPVRKSAVRDKTFEKLGLGRPERQPPPHEQWSQAEPVVKRPRPWAMVAACLAVVALVGAALWALPLATAPGQGQSGPLPRPQSRCPNCPQCWVCKKKEHEQLFPITKKEGQAPSFSILYNCIAMQSKFKFSAPL